MAKKKTLNRSSNRRGTLLKDASLSQLENEIAKRRASKLQALEKERADIEAKIASMRGATTKSAARSLPSRSKSSKSSNYKPRKGSHGDLVVSALAEGGEWTLDDLSNYTGAGKPTLSVSVLPKLIREGLASKAGRGKYRSAT